MLTRLRDESLIHERLRDLRREARAAALAAGHRERLAESAPRPANEEAPWIRAGLPARRAKVRPAFEG